MVGSIKRKNMAAPASAPPLPVNPRTDELIVKITLHTFTDEKGTVTTLTTPDFRRGRFSNPSLEDIKTWLGTATGYVSKRPVYYKDEDGDRINMFAEQDWDECVCAWRERNEKVLKLHWS